MASKQTFSQLFQKGKQFAEEHPELVSQGVEFLKGVVQTAMQKKEGNPEALEGVADGENTEVDVPVTPVVKNGEIVDEPADENDTYFEDMLCNLQNAAAEGLKNPEAAMQALGILADAAQQTIKYVAEQETKRVEIVARRDEAIARINAFTGLIKEYLDKTFDERSAIFAKQFECVDAALQAGNTDMLAASLNSINALAAQSPFKQLADLTTVQQNLSSGETEWDI